MRTATTKEQNDIVSFPCQLHLQPLWCLSRLFTNMYSERSLDIQTLLREIKRHLAHGSKNTRSVKQRETAVRRKRGGDKKGEDGRKEKEEGCETLRVRK